MANLDGYLAQMAEAVESRGGNVFFATDEPLEAAGTDVVIWRDPEDFREIAARVDIGLSTAEWAVAETGSLMLAGGPGKGRSVMLLRCCPWTGYSVRCRRLSGSMLAETSRPTSAYTPGPAGRGT